MCPNWIEKLVSVPALTGRGVVVQVERDRATLVVDGEVLDVIHRNGKLFMWHLQQLKGEQAAQVERADGTLWHAQLGHISASKMQAAEKISMDYLSFLMKKTT
ncbi:hypothetical protein Plhal304r1_c017g0062591 [Plasmopara halstedii]